MAYALSRRALLAGIAALPLVGTANAGDSLTFEQLYDKITVLGLSFSPKVKALAGKTVSIRGFMAPPLKAEAKFFVLTEIPMSICPFCDSDSDWPSNIVVVYIDDKTTFLPPSKLIEVTGTLEVGSWTDPETGFVSQLRLVHSSFETV